MPAVTYARALEVIKLVAEGDTVLQACEKFMMQPAQFKGLCRREPSLASLLADAEETRDDILADMLVDQNKLPSDPKMASVISSNIRFLLERRRSTKYGKQNEQAGNSETEQNKLLAEALRAAVDRIPLPAQPAPAQIVDATFSVVETKIGAPVSPPAPHKVREETPPPEVGDGLEELRRLGFL